MAPEIINLVLGSQGSPSRSETKKHPFMCDVYSFAMVCYEMLIGEEPFQIVTIPRELKEMVLANKRPNLLDHCLSKLKALITKCRDKTHEERPSFDVICLELKYLKCLLMIGFNEGPHPPIEEPLPAGVEDIPLVASTVIEEEPLQVATKDMPLEAPTIMPQSSLFPLLKISFDYLLEEEQLVFMDVVLYYPKLLLWSKPLNCLKWLNMVNGASIDVIKSQLEMLRELAFLRSYSDGSTTIVVYPVWRKYCVEEATKLGALDDHRWVFEVHSPHFRPGDSSLCLREGGWEKIQRIYLKGGVNSGISNLENLRHCTNVRVLKLVSYHVAEDQVLDLSSLKSLRSLEILSCTFSTTENSPAKVLGLGLLRNLAVLKWDNILVFELEELRVEGCWRLDLPDLTKLTKLTGFRVFH